MAAPQASSRLELLQARFQQKQLQEKEQKLLQLYDQQQQRAYQVVQRGSAGSNNPNHGSSITTVTRSSSSTHTTSTSQGGKVRQMFDERRQTGVKGIDRSYPLEPLENKPRKQQTNGQAPQRNGNFTVSRQSVTVKRVARADVNSNLNDGKPVISYHEEVTRESFGSPLDEDKNEFGNETHLSRYANGNGEIRIEEVLDSPERGKLHLMEYEEKQRVRNDLESEIFPEDLIADVPDKLPKRTATRKLSQAEARLERFKNANAKRTTPPRTTTTSTTTTVTKKRSEPILPAKSTSSNAEASRSRLAELIGGKSIGRAPTPSADGQSMKESSRSASTESRRSVASAGKVRSRLSSPELIRSVEETIDKPDFFCVESQRSATTYSAKPTISWTNKTKKPAQSAGTSARTRPSIRKKRSDEPDFFCKENERSATTFSLKPRPTVTKSPGIDSKSTGRKSESSTEESSRPKYLCREADGSPTTMSSAIVTRVQSVARPEGIARRPGESSQSPGANCKATSGADVKSKLRITSPSGSEKQAHRAARTSPTFFGPDAEKSATTITVVPETIRKSRAVASAMKKREDWGTKKSCFNRVQPTVSLKDLGKGSPRGGSPKYFGKETEIRINSTNLDLKARSSRSPSPAKLIEKRESSPQFLSATISPKLRLSNGSIGGRSGSPRSEPEKAASTRSDKKSVNQFQTSRRLSKSPDTSPFGRKVGTSRKGSGHVLRSIGLIRAVISPTGNAYNLSRKQGTFEKRRPSKSDESDGLSLGKIYKPTKHTDNRPRTPVSPRKLVSPTSPLQSFSSAEGDAEIQEITLSHRYVRGDKVDDTKKEDNVVVGRTYSKSCGQRGSSSSENSKCDTPATFSVGKSSKKRGSLLRSNIFAPMCTRTRDQASASKRRSSSESRSSSELARTVSLGQITRNKSRPERRSPGSASPPFAAARSTFCTAKRRTRSEIVGGRVTPRSPVQTSSSSPIRRSRESPINSGRSIFGEFRKSSPLRATISPTSARRVGKSSGTKAVGTLRSTVLVRGVMDVGGEGGKMSLGKDKNQEDRGKGGVSIEDYDRVGSMPEDFDEEKHKVVKKDKAVYPGLAIGKLEDPSRTETENMKLTDSTGKWNESADYVRTDSVESALRRFDSIGGESTRTYALGSTSQTNLHKTEEHGSILNEVKNRRGSVSPISLKELDLKRPISPLRIKEASTKSTLTRTPTFKISKSKILTSSDAGSKKLTKARDSIKTTRVSTNSRSPGCKRRLFQDSDSGEESKRAASKRATITKKTAGKIQRNPIDPDSVSLKQLRSIEDIRKSMRSNASCTRLNVHPRKVSRPKSAIAYKVRQSPVASMLESKNGPISPVYRSRVTSWKSGGSPGAKDLFLKDRTPLSRITKSPSPEPRKVTETGVRTGTSRRGVTPSPSKSPETTVRAFESKAARRPVAAGSKKNAAVPTKKSPDVVDGAENGSPHPLEDTVNHTSTRKADAFVIDFDEPPREEPAQARKPPPRKHSGEKLSSPTTPARPSSTMASGTPHTSKTKMSSRTKSSLNTTSATRPCPVMKSANNRTSAENLMACKICGRHFAQDRVRFHEEICSKTAQKKRKQFDAMQFRVKGTELEPFFKKGLIKKNDARTSKSDAKSDWRRKHEDFINAIRSAKQVQAHLAAGGKLSDLPPPPPSDYSDYIQCPHCGRKFNQAAAERHIPKCENMLHNKPVHNRAPKPRR